jgi:hypothetical protein
MAASQRVATEWLFSTQSAPFRRVVGTITMSGSNTLSRVRCATIGIRLARLSSSAVAATISTSSFTRPAASSDAIPKVS